MTPEGEIMTLINMKMKSKEAEEIMESKAMDGPKYPYGLSLHLDMDTLEKLGMVELPEVGKEMSLMAKVKVESTHQCQNMSGEENKSMSLQITDMALEAVKEPTDIVKKLYK